MGNLLKDLKQIAILSKEVIKGVLKLSTWENFKNYWKER